MDDVPTKSQLLEKVLAVERIRRPFSSLGSSLDGIRDKVGNDVSNRLGEEDDEGEVANGKIVAVRVRNYDAMNAAFRELYHSNKRYKERVDKLVKKYEEQGRRSLVVTPVYTLPIKDEVFVGILREVFGTSVSDGDLMRYFNMAEEISKYVPRKRKNRVEDLKARILLRS